MTTETKITEPPKWIPRLHLSVYSISESSRYTGVNKRTISYWYYEGKQLGPAIKGKLPRTPLSYLQLIELAFVATYRKLGVSLQNIRRTRDYARKTLGFEYPFAQLRWKTEGVHLLLELKDIEKEAELDRLLVGDKFGQITWKPMIMNKFKQFEYERDLAIVWHLVGEKSPIIIDPRVAFGEPSIRGIPTWIIRERWKSGQTLRDIKNDYLMPIYDIRRALQFEMVSLG